MQIKKIVLKNFRQYIDQEVIFSTDKEKNVTIVMGDGGSGKTTLAQAFTWVLYENVDFSNKTILNSKVQQNMPEHAERKVSVELYLEHTEIDYIIKREAVYTKKDGKVKSLGNGKLKVFVVEEGNQRALPDLQAYSRVKQILPKELSRYFFFDGEKLQKMSEELERGKSQEFADAVQGLLGMSALLNLMRHTKPNVKRSVVGYYEEKINQSGDSKVQKLGREIDSDRQRLENLNQQIEKNTEQLEYYNKKREEIKLKLAEFKSIEEQQRRYNQLEADEQRCITDINNIMKVCFANFHSENTVSFFSKVLMKETLEELKNTGNIDMGIPCIQDETIYHLLKVRKRCICGEPLVDGDSHIEELKKLLEFIPPKSVGGSITELKEEMGNKIKSADTYYMNFSNGIKRWRELEQQLEVIRNEISEIDQSILGQDGVIRDLKEKQKDCENKIKEYNRKNNMYLEQIGAVKNQIEKNESEREKKLVKLENIKKYELFREYAKQIYEKVENDYVTQEEGMRNRLEETINEVFQEIYGKGITVGIDKRYHIQVNTDEVIHIENNLDHSTSQNYSVIFAFIAGIIKMQKENALEKARNNILQIGGQNMNSAESYPLVMDAPLSAFDKTRIKNICEVFPGIAEQVIVFIKDTDGDIAKKYMSEKIGKLYRIKMQGHIDSRIEEEAM